MVNKKILVISGTGTIGSHLVDSLDAQGYSVTAIQFINFVRKFWLLPTLIKTEIQDVESDNCFHKINISTLT